MRKVRYEVDPHNRLVLTGTTEGREGLPRFRKVLDGEFRTDGNNNLSYHIKIPLSKTEEIPSQIRIKGAWSLTDDHKLRLTVDRSLRRTFGEKIILQGDILDVKGNSLLFAVTTTSKKGTQSTYVLDLGGAWRADANNRLSFHVKREKGAYDILTLTGAWEIGKNNRIVYCYETASLIKKKTRTHTLIFKGRWDIKEELRISYEMSAGTDSSFDFKASAGVFKKDYIEYELGIGLSGRAKPVARIITLSGAWNFRKGCGLVFEIEYGEGPDRAIAFGADAELTSRDTISIRLKSRLDGADLGGRLELSHKIFKGEGEVFLRLIKSGEESAAYGGAAWRW